MPRRVIASLFVAIWFVLFGIEFLEDAGVFEYSQSDINRSVVSALASLGEAIKTSDDAKMAPPPAFALPADDSLSPIVKDLFFGVLKGEEHAPKKGVNLYQLYCSLLL